MEKENLKKQQTASRWRDFMAKYDDLPKPLRRGKYGFIFIMLILSVLSFAVFYVYVNFSSIIMGFQEFIGYDENNQPVYEWGFGNFIRLWEDLTYDGYASQSFKAALKNTLFLFVMGNIITLPLQYIISYYLYKKIPGHKVFRVLLYLPSILSTVVMVTIFKNIVEVNELISAITQRLTGKAVTVLLSTDE